MKKRINVTQRDIDAGSSRDPHHCPIAIAANRALRSTSVSVGSGAMFWGVYVGHEALLPLEARRFIRNLDDGGYAEPFSFEIEVPS
jgi:hypothetical protein